jgi:hypothetical protein
MAMVLSDANVGQDRLPSAVTCRGELRRVAAEGQCETQESFFSLALDDVREAARLLRSECTLLSRLCLTTFALTLAAVGNGIAPLEFVALVAAAVLAQLLLEAIIAREGAATAWGSSSW